MSVPRQPPPKRLLPELELRTKPAVSGEYRIVGEARKRSSTTMQAVRPELRRRSSTSLPATRVPAPIAAPSQSGPRRYKTVQMEAVAPLSAGRELHELDFDFDFDIDADGALELDDLPFSQSMSGETRRSSMQGAPPALARPSGQMARMTPAPMPRMTPGPILPPAPAWPMSSSTGGRSSAKMAAVDPHAALVAFSGFGDPPAGMCGMPGYAARVILRRRALRRDLELARLRQSHDVGLYEAALRTADDGAVRNGLILTAVLFIMMTVFVWVAIAVTSGALVVPW